MKPNKALINYYARLIQKGNYQMNNVPVNLREDVEKSLAELPPLKVDPDTQAPS